MAWYAGAVKKEIHPGVNDPAITPLGVILHTDAGNQASLFNYFNGPSGGIESHFHIPKKNPVEQYRDTGFEADANLKANSFYVGGKRYGFLSVETQGLASDPWNDYQLAEIKKLILWAKGVHPLIKLRVCPGAYDAGIGYHTLFGSPGPWTPVAKSCPGPVRIKQFRELLVPWFSSTTPVPDVDPTPTVPSISLAACQYTANHNGQYLPNGTDDSLNVKAYLVRHGYALASDSWRTAYSKFQRHLGYDGAAADGIPGKTSLGILCKSANWRLVP